ncbi:MAG: hypothetical protein U0232_16430 [Thermomicrobiales bacterium]
MSSRTGGSTSGIGAGWNEYEHASMGLNLYKPGERCSAARQAAAGIWKSLCTRPTTNPDRRYYQLKEARCRQRPVQKPTRRL